MAKKRMGEMRSDDTIEEIIESKVEEKLTMARIDRAAANAPTDLSGVQPGPGLLSQVAAANSRYNDLAVKFNSLLDRLEQVGLMK